MINLFSFSALWCCAFYVAWCCGVVRRFVTHIAAVFDEKLKDS